MPYFVIGIFFCAFYLMNLVLAMVYLSYEQELSSEGKEVLLDTANSINTGESTQRVNQSAYQLFFAFFSRRKSSRRNSLLDPNKFDN